MHCRPSMRKWVKQGVALVIDESDQLDREALAADDDD